MVTNERKILERELRMIVDGTSDEVACTVNMRLQISDEDKKRWKWQRHHHLL